jgi:hypothetical protein
VQLGEESHVHFVSLYLCLISTTESAAPAGPVGLSTAMRLLTTQKKCDQIMLIDAKLSTCAEAVYSELLCACMQTTQMLWPICVAVFSWGTCRLRESPSGELRRRPPGSKVYASVSCTMMSSLLTPRLSSFLVSLHPVCIHLPSLAYMDDLPMIESLLVRYNPITLSAYCWCI